MAEEQAKVPFTEILRSLSAEKFQEVLATSSRKARETYFHRHGVKASGWRAACRSRGPRTKSAPPSFTRSYATRLMTKCARRSCALGCSRSGRCSPVALDHLGIPHRDGLTESDDIKKFEKLSGGDMKAIVKKLDGVAAKK